MINRNGTKKILKIGIVSIISIIIIGYTLLTSYDFINGPKIVVTNPISGNSTTTSSVELVGQALRIQDITLNGRPILIDEKGNFDEILLLAPGYNAFLLSAYDKFGRTTEYKIELVYQI